MKVLVVNTVPFDKNGITSVILNYYKKMTKDIEQIDFIAINDLADEYKELFKQNGSQSFVIRNRKRNPLNYVIKLFGILRKNKYDIIHVHGNSTLVVIELFTAFLAGVRVRIAHSHNTTCDFQKLNAFLRPLFNAMYTHGLACGKEAGVWMFQDKPFTVIHNGIDLEMFKFNEEVRKQIRQEENISDTTYVIGHIGGFVYQKNHAFLIEVVKKLTSEMTNFKVMCLGDGPLRGRIEEEATKSNVLDYISFLGNKAEVYKYYNAFDLFVLPSHFEGLPVVMVEAQANNLELLVSDTITKDAQIGSCVSYIPLEVDQWVYSIKEAFGKRLITQVRNQKESTFNKLKDSRFDIDINASQLVNYYKNITKK